MSGLNERAVSESYTTDHAVYVKDAVDGEKAITIVRIALRVDAGIRSTSSTSVVTVSVDATDGSLTIQRTGDMRVIT